MGPLVLQSLLHEKSWNIVYRATIKIGGWGRGRKRKWSWQKLVYASSTELIQTLWYQCSSFIPQIARVAETCNICISLLQQTDVIEGKCCFILPVEKPRSHFPAENVREGRWCPGFPRLSCTHVLGFQICQAFSPLLPHNSSTVSRTCCTFFHPFYSGSQITLSSCSSLFASPRLSWSVKVSLTHVSPVTESFCSSIAMQFPFLQWGWMDYYLTSLAVIEKKVYSFGLNNLLRCGRKEKVSL